MKIRLRMYVSVVFLYFIETSELLINFYLNALYIYIELQCLFFPFVHDAVRNLIHTIMRIYEESNRHMVCVCACVLVAVYQQTEARR